MTGIEPEILLLFLANPGPVHEQAQGAVIAIGAGGVIACAQDFVLVRILTENKTGGLLIEIGRGKTGAKKAFVQTVLV